ncbi:MAG: response regulator transcription factor [Erysipelotrichia bacterium]|nr:response regulator transcription factor [Erysipelotrichia bacterium]
MICRGTLPLRKHMKILVVEDQREIVELLKMYLENEGYTVLCAADGVEGLMLFQKEHVDLCLLDVMLPKMNGFELAKKIREESEIPFIFLTAKNSDMDKIEGFNFGADDYITKPFNNMELLARIRAVMKRYHALNYSVISIGSLTINANEISCMKNGENVQLTPMEFKLLYILMQHPNQVFTKAQLAQMTRGSYYDADDSVIMTHISRLRDKLKDEEGKETIQTLKGLGYRFISEK